MKRFILSLFLFLCLLTTNIKAQNYAYFGLEPIENFIAKRMLDIQTNIVQKALKGEIKAYINDSLTRSFNLIQLKYRCYLIHDTDNILDTHKLKRNLLNSIIFQSEIKMINSISQIKQLNSFSILNSDGFNICSFNWQEIAKKLPQNDVQFLSSLYQVKMNDIVQIDTTERIFYYQNYLRYLTYKQKLVESKYSSWEDMFYHKSYHKVTKLDIFQISYMTTYNLWWTLKDVIKDNEKVFLKDGKYLKSLNEIANENSDTIITKIYRNPPGLNDTVLNFVDSSTGQNIKKLITHSIETNEDTMYIEESYINSINYSLLMLGKEDVKTLSVNFKKNYDANYRITLSWSFIKKRHPQKWLIYFLEEYFKANHETLDEWYYEFH